MRELHEISRIGFGGYRISRHSDMHREALCRALSTGCNLIDTAATYTNGDSEALIGDVLATHSNREAFVITKAGYLHHDSLGLLEQANRAGDVMAECVRTSTDTLHSIHPWFLELQIEGSCQRLRRTCLDGFLLHNPEYYFDQTDRLASSAEFYARIARAFEFLEEQVARQRIRYYGVSSNTLPRSTADTNAVSLKGLLAVARQISNSHHFALIQFPFNLVETDAALPNQDGRTLLEMARAERVVTFGNRPLNACSAEGTLRLATYEDELDTRDGANDAGLLEECLRHVQQRLDAIESPDTPLDFVPMQMISDSWRHCGSSEVVDDVFDGRLLPFLQTLYAGEIDDEVVRAFASLRAVALKHTRRHLTGQAVAFRQKMIARGTIAADDERDFAAIACQYALEAGVDHVLVGMRRPSYVDRLRPLWDDGPPRRIAPAGAAKSASHAALSNTLGGGR